jgi:cyanophycinase
MRRSIRFACILALGLSSVLPAAAQSAPKGHLLVIGGNGTTDDIVQRAVQAAGAARGMVAIFPQASELPDTGKSAVEMWTKAGIGQAVVLDPQDPASAIRALQTATFIWFPGGDQNRLMHALEGTGIPDAIRARYRDGALVGGTSAGAAVMSKVMLTGEADLQSITVAKTETAPGLALWPEAIVDQHFLKRQRGNRLISAVLDHPDLVGVGIDETTAVFVSGAEFEVLGRSSVVVVDARRARVDRAAPGQPATGVGLTISVLKAGMRYRLD